MSNAIKLVTREKVVMDDVMMKVCGKNEIETQAGRSSNYLQNYSLLLLNILREDPHIYSVLNSIQI